MSKTTTRNTNANAITKFKVKRGDEIRRFELASPNFQTLQSTLNHIFPSIQNMTVKYTDNEGDQILITSESEFYAALDSLNEESLLYLTITEDESKSPIPKTSRAIMRNRAVLIKPLRFHRHHCRHRGRGGRIHGHGNGHRHLLSRLNPQVMAKLGVVEEKKRVVNEIRESKGNGKPSEEWKNCMMEARKQLIQARVELRMARREAREAKKGEKMHGNRGGCGARKRGWKKRGALVHRHPHNRSPGNYDQNDSTHSPKCHRKPCHRRHFPAHLHVKHYDRADIC